MSFVNLDLFCKMYLTRFILGLPPTLLAHLPFPDKRGHSLGLGCEGKETDCTLEALSCRAPHMLVKRSGCLVILATLAYAGPLLSTDHISRYP